MERRPLNPSPNRYAELLARVRSLRREKARKTAQLAHYTVSAGSADFHSCPSALTLALGGVSSGAEQHLTSLLPSISASSIASHSLYDDSSALRLALDQTAEIRSSLSLPLTRQSRADASSTIVPGVTEEVEADWRELSTMKREKKRAKRAGESCPRPRRES